MALLGLLAVAVMVFAYVLTSRLNAASRFVGIDREHNAKVLNRAKQALIGYMAQQAAMAGENNPGHLPCPEAPANFGTANEGIEASFCAAPAVGRLPWRTLGLDRLVDAAGEPLWYAVSNGWHRPNSTATLTINSDSFGQLALDGVANDAVALIIAPGAVLSVQAGAGCTAWTQARPIAGPPDLRNYLECGNTTSNFVTGSPGNTFNDQVLRVTAADVMPALEAAIADRMQREIAPVLKTVYTSSQYSGIPSSSPLYPYAAPFANPGTANFQGAAGTYQGLLPFSQTQGCNPATDARCTTTLVDWSSGTPPTAYKTGGFGSIYSQSCSWQSSGTVALCSGRYDEDPGNQSGPGMIIAMTATINNVAMGLRFLDTTKATIEAENNDAVGAPLAIVTPSVTATMNSNGSVTITFSGTLPNIDVKGWESWALYRIRLERSVIGDHFLLNPATTGPGAATSWFVRNEWYRVNYYAVAQANTAAALAAFGCDSSNCLRINDPATRNIRALLILAGHSLSNPAGRPNATLLDYVENQNGDLGTLYEQRPARRLGSAANPNAPWNDRVVLVDWNSSPVVPTQVLSTSPLRVASLP